jgi:hypothetical protein
MYLWLIAFVSAKHLFLVTVYSTEHLTFTQIKKFPKPYEYTASINRRTKDYIEKGESDGKSLIDAMEQGDQAGMQTFDAVIENFIRQGHGNA